MSGATDKERGYIGDYYIGIIKGDTRSLDFSPCLVQQIRLGGKPKPEGSGRGGETADSISWQVITACFI